MHLTIPSTLVLNICLLPKRGSEILKLVDFIEGFQLGQSWKTIRSGSVQESDCVYLLHKLIQGTYCINFTQVKQKIFSVSHLGSCIKESRLLLLFQSPMCTYFLVPGRKKSFLFFQLSKKLH